CRSSRYIRILFTMDMAVFEPGGGGAEDKIRGAFDIAIFVILPASIATEKEDILVTDDPAAVEYGPVATDFYAYGLAGGEAGIVAEGELFRCKVVCRDAEAIA